MLSSLAKSYFQNDIKFLKFYLYTHTQNNLKVIIRSSIHQLVAAFSETRILASRTLYSYPKRFKTVIEDLSLGDVPD